MPVIRCTREQYQEYDAVSQSMLKKAYSNPLLFYQQHIAKTRPRDERTKAQWFGLAVEDYIRNKGKSDDLDAVVVIPESVLDKNGHRRGNAWKAFRDLPEHKGKILLTEDEYEDKFGCLEEIYENCCRHPFINDLLSWTAEWSTKFIWDINTHGRALTCKAELDAIFHDVIRDEGPMIKRLIVDIKALNDIDKPAFTRKVNERGYHIQLAMYRQALINNSRVDSNDIAQGWIAIRNKPPFDVAFYWCDMDLIEIANKDLSALFENYCYRAENAAWFPIVEEAIQPEKWWKPMEFSRHEHETEEAPKEDSE